MANTQSKPTYSILSSISFSHMLNDMIQSLLLAIYPMLKHSFSLSFAQIGLITLCYQITSSLLQPIVGIYTDKHPQPYSLPIGMFIAFIGLILLAFAPHFYVILIAAALIGCGSASFHPEASRVARLASSGQHGLAQSIFQVGGYAGSSIGPLLAALIIIPHGQHSIAWLSIASMTAILILFYVSHWYKTHHMARIKSEQIIQSLLSQKQKILAICILLSLIFSKFFYLSSINNYFTFYLMEKFQISTRFAQIHLFIFFLFVTLGTVIGGALTDRIGKKQVIWISILGTAPFTILLPYANLYWTTILSMCIGFIISSAFSAILVYAQELFPGKVGTISGLFFGIAFGLGGIGAALLGYLADLTNILFVYKVCSFLPLLGLLTIFLPNLDATKHTRNK